MRHFLATIVAVGLIVVGLVALRGDHKLSGVALASSAAPRGQTLAWSDEFSGSQLSDRSWAYVTGGGGYGNNELQTDTKSAVTVSHGKLLITASKDGSSYTSGSIQTLGKVSAQYGMVEARIKVPQGKGLWPAFWMQGSDAPAVGWPADGEADLMEILGNDDRTDRATIHTSARDDASSSWQRSFSGSCGCRLSGGFHTYAIAWSPGKMRFMLDGRTFGVATEQSVERDGGVWPFNAPFFLILDLAVGGRGDGAPTASTHFPASMAVDWIRVYEPTEPQFALTQPLITGSEMCLYSQLQGCRVP